MSSGLSRRGLLSLFGHPLRTAAATAQAVTGALTGQANTTTPSLDRVAAIHARYCIAHTSPCRVCVERCPVIGAMTVQNGIPMVMLEACTGCGVCHDVCPAPTNAVLLLPRPRFPLARPVPAQDLNSQTPVWPTPAIQPPAPLPDFNTSTINPSQVEQLLHDIEQSAEITEVIPKLAAKGHFLAKAGVTLAEARALLLTRAIRGLQLRYRRDGAEWMDTLMFVGDGFRLVRIRHDLAVNEAEPQPRRDDHPASPPSKG